jgi:NAD-dependent SIR2 family protein deacetylase
MTELFLLGAGASVEAGIPDAYKMTNEMLKKLTEDDMSRFRRIDKVLQFVAGGLLFQQGIKGENPFDGVNIEDLFNAVKLLGDRQKSELGPFISSWHPQLVGLESGRMASSTSRKLLETIYKPIQEHVEESTKELRKEVMDDIGRALEGRHVFSRNSRSKKIETFFASTRFEDSLKEAIRQVVIGGEGELFKTAADAMILKLVEMVWITDPIKVAYLVPLLQYAKDTNSIIATLNYDNSIELAGQNASIEIDTGFDSWSNSGDFIFDEHKTPLLKLHGSIDWALSDGRTSKEKPLPFQIIQKVDPNADKQSSFHPAVVFGGKNKLTAKGPFLSLLRAFDLQLSKSEILWMIGYSFRDEHVNEFIVNWFNADPTRAIKIINPKPDSLDTEFTQHLLRGSANERVHIISKTTAEGVLNLIKA